MSAAGVSKRHAPDPASEDSVDACPTRPHREPLAAQSPRQRPPRSCLAPCTAHHRAPGSEMPIFHAGFRFNSNLISVPRRHSRPFGDFPAALLVVAMIIDLWLVGPP